MTVLAEIKSILMDLKDLKSLRLLSNRDEHKAKPVMSLTLTISNSQEKYDIKNRYA